MEIRRSGVSAHKRHIAPDIDGAVAVKKKVKSVSVASIFKQQAKKTKNFNTMRQINLAAASSVTKDAPAREVDTPKLLSSSRSPHKSSSRVSKRVDLHPLLVEFKDVSRAYRSNLYNDTAETIQKDLNAFLRRLHEGTTMKTVRSDDQPNSIVLPIRTSVPCQYESLSKRICSPLSEYTACCSYTRTRGEEESTGATIHERFFDFDEQIRTQTKDIKKLQTQWEAIVREIFKLGVTCLGEDTMTAMLLPTPAAQTTQDQPSSSPSDPDAELTLFVPEKDTADKGKGKKKKVSFEQAESAVALPKFLYQPSMFRKRIAPEAPRLSGTKVTGLQADVAQLGNAQVHELREVEREYAAWWKKKTALIASALGDD